MTSCVQVLPSAEICSSEAVGAVPVAIRCDQRKTVSALPSTMMFFGLSATAEDKASTVESVRQPDVDTLPWLSVVSTCHWMESAVIEDPGSV